MALKAAYSFDAGSGTVIADDSGNGNSLTLGATQNVTWTASGSTGAAIKGNATGSGDSGGGNYIGAVKTGDAALWINGGTNPTGLSFTFKFNIPVTQIAGGMPFIIIADSAGTATPAVSIRTGGTNGWMRSIIQSTVSGQADCGSTTGWNDGAWHVFACVIDVAGNSVSNYIDGVVRETVAWPGGAGSGAVKLGGDFSVLGCPIAAIPNADTNASIDDLRVYNHALTSTEVSNDAAAVSSGSSGPSESARYADASLLMKIYAGQDVWNGSINA